MEEKVKLTIEDVENMRTMILDLTGTTCVNLNKSVGTIDNLITSLPSTAPEKFETETANACYVKLFNQLQDIRSSLLDCRTEVIELYSNLGI